MIPYFIKLFKYDRYANLKMLDGILASGVTGRPAAIMAHIAAAQQRWLVRCKNLPVTDEPLWPDPKIETLEAAIEQTYQDWMAYLNSLQESDIQQTITYKNTKGEAFTNTLEDILAHVINHGTHHRGQIGQLLKIDGLAQLPNTDYIFYIREL